MKYEYNTISNSEYLGDGLLNRLGENGWELVSHTYVPDRSTHYYAFKREKVGKVAPCVGHELASQEEEEQNRRMDIIGQNGNEGTHYDK